jgi:hypothetical protein
MAIPSATLKIKTVDGLSLTPAQPIIPAVTIKGITLGMSEHINILKDLNKYSMHKEINKNAHMILSLRP